jgi:transcription elongation factor SPT6
VVVNFIAKQQVHLVHDQELNPSAYAEQFGDPDPSRVLTADELLRRARMILSTELGRDPILRMHMRKLFQEDAQISVHPTERGIAKIDEHSRFHVCEFHLF